MGQHINPLLFEGQHLVRQLDVESEIWFVGIDVCRVLELSNPRSSIALLDEDEKGVHTVDTLGGEQEMTIVSEAGVYRLVFKSRKPVAERFKRWLAHEVIPAIRKTGSYAAPDSAATTERLPFPEWPMDELRTKCTVINTYLRMFGIEAARWAAPQLGFPVPPSELIERNRQLSMNFGGADFAP